MISAAGGGAVVLGICVLMIIVFYKRRKSRYMYVCKASFSNQPIECLKWILGGQVYETHILLHMLLNVLIWKLTVDSELGDAYM